MAEITEQTPLAAPEQRPKRKGLVAAVAAVSLALAVVVVCGVFLKRRLDRKVEVRVCDLGAGRDQ